MSRKRGLDCGTGRDDAGSWVDGNVISSDSGGKGKCADNCAGKSVSKDAGGVSCTRTGAAAAVGAELQVAGIVPFSTVDWPDHLVATVFCQGCPWRCVYCQNHEILSFRTPGQVSLDKLWELLAARRGLLDGVVFSGGEALAQPALLAAVQKTKEMGFATGLHSAGAYPNHLQQLLEHQLLDWVGHDIKALPANYRAVTGVAGAGSRAWHCLDMILAASAHPKKPLDYEVRLTIYPNSPVDPVVVAKELKRRGVKYFALQEARLQGAPLEFQARCQDWLDIRKVTVTNPAIDPQQGHLIWSRQLFEWDCQLQTLGFARYINRCHTSLPAGNIIQ